MSLIFVDFVENISLNPKRNKVGLESTWYMIYFDPAKLILLHMLHLSELFDYDQSPALNKMASHVAMER